MELINIKEFAHLLGKSESYARYLRQKHPLFPNHETKVKGFLMYKKTLALKFKKEIEKNYRTLNRRFPEEKNHWPIPRMNKKEKTQCLLARQFLSMP